MENWTFDTAPTPLAAPPLPALGTFEPLRRAERIVLRAWFAGDIAKLAFQRPTGPLADVTVRGAFLAHLARGGDAPPPPGGRRLQLLGAWIEGPVDLGGATIAASLWFFRCVFDRPPMLDDARVAGSVVLADCRLPGLFAERVRIAGDLALHAGTKTGGEVRLARARIEGDLKLDRLRLPAPTNARPGRRALVADLVEVDGDLNLSGGFEAHGEVRFPGARIAGTLDAAGARLTASTDPRGARLAALNLDGARVDGDLHLADGFAAAGTVRLRRARIGGDVECAGATFDTAGDAAWGEGHGLVLDGARVGGALRVARLSGPLLGASFGGARVRALLDDATSWGERNVLDGLDVRRLAPGAPTDAAFRIQWLMRQPPEQTSATDWREAPWALATALLRRAGCDHAADEVEIARERLRRRVGLVGAGLPAALGTPLRALHALLGAVAGYGYRPWRIVGGLVLAWVIGTAVFVAADHEGQIRATAVPAAAFSAPAYALDLLLPGIDLGEQHRFAPAGPASASACVDGPLAAGCVRGVARWTGVGLAALGWFGIALLAASLAGVFGRRR